MTSLAELLMRNRLDAVGDKPEYTTADVNSLMPTPAWKSPLAGLGSYQLSQEAGAEPNWFGRNVLSNIPPEAMHAANFLIPSKVPRLPNPIKAYHGSPHDFDKFDLSKIGTGEGKQAYGHGLYFAEREGVARSYRDNLSSPWGKHGSDAQAAAIAALERDKDYANAINRMERERVAGRPDAGSVAQDFSGWHIKYPYGVSPPFASRKEAEAALAAQSARDQARLWEGAELLRKWRDEGRDPRNPTPGRMYEVALHATPEQFLDWDKPLGGQSPKVREALAAWNTNGSRALPANEQFGRGGADLSDYLLKGADRAAFSAHMADSGVPGMRYFDQMSRSGKEGTRNAVVWSPEIIEILRKYGLAPAIAAPALASVLQGDNQ